MIPAVSSFFLFSYRSYFISSFFSLTFSSPPLSLFVLSQLPLTPLSSFLGCPSLLLFLPFFSLFHPSLSCLLSVIPPIPLYSRLPLLTPVPTPFSSLTLSSPSLFCLLSVTPLPYTLSILGCPLLTPVPTPFSSLTLSSPSLSSSYLSYPSHPSPFSSVVPPYSCSHSFFFSHSFIPLSLVFSQLHPSHTPSLFSVAPPYSCSHSFFFSHSFIPLSFSFSHFSFHLPFSSLTLSSPSLFCLLSVTPLPYPSSTLFDSSLRTSIISRPNCT